MNHGLDDESQNGPNGHNGLDGHGGHNGLDGHGGLNGLGGHDGLDGHDGLGGLGSDELALRAMLHQAVGGIQPTDAALDHLRRAVPARRARKRHAAIGMAAAALFIGTAVPALVHVSNVADSKTDPSVIAGHGSPSQEGKDSGDDPDGGEGNAGSGGSGTVKDRPSASPSDGKAGPGGKSGGGGGGSVTGGSGPANDAGMTPACDAAQLGSATGSVGAPDAGGAVYGTFRVVNVSSASCSVGGSGTVSLLAQGAADQSKLATADHTEGDAAAGLPAPSASVSGLVLAPGAAYTVKFAWVPAETCPTVGTPTDGGATGGPTESPTPTPSDTPGPPAATSSTGGDTGAAPQLVTEDGATADGSVAVSYTAEAGSPTVTATVPNACAGTVYRTGVLAETS
ncbi:hypothetical protein [Streptomyces graminilatus]|uniref:hypothetical protein n=1 Tax=Streptomyces graminilatus TaxID=1464070 RepID=UPI001F51AA88|nr:hypothetical protein [Streptomyces graminilatus]